MCIRCGKNKGVYQRSGDGSAICKNCYSRPKKKCFLCGEVRIVKKNINGNPHCAKCYAKIDVNENLRRKLRCRLREALVNFGKGKELSSCKYGVNYKEIILYLCENKPIDYIENNYHIDHIIPLHMFDFDNLDHIKYAFLPENHQWLLAEQNLRKGGKCSRERFRKYLKLVESGLRGQELEKFLLKGEEE